MTTSPDVVQYPDVHVQLNFTGPDGNAFMLIGKVAKEIRRNVGSDSAAKFSGDAMNCGSYDELLQFIQSTVNVS